MIAAPCIGLSFTQTSKSQTSVQTIKTDPLYSEYTNLSSSMTQVFSNDSTSKDFYPTASEKDADHTWAFVGGKASGTLDDLQAARNYIGDFEEDIRGMWTYPASATSNSIRSQNLMNYLQRFVNDLTVPGYTLSDINQNWDRVTNTNPESVAYLISDEDFLKNNSTSQQNLNDFKMQLVFFILNGLSLRDGNGYVFIQKHWATNDSNTNNLIQAYNNQVDNAIAIINSIDPSYLDRITVVNHYINTVNDKNFLQNDLNEDNQLNRYGQFEIGEQFADGTYGKVTSNGQPININWGALTASSQYPNVYGGFSDKVDLDKTLANEVLSMNSNGSFYINELKTTQPVSDFLTYTLPTVTSNADATTPTLTVTLPSGITATAFVYRIWLSSGYYIEGTAVAINNSFTIPNLQPNKTYFLKIFSIDGKQLPTVYGNTSTSGVTAMQITNTYQQEFQQKIQNSKKLNWVVIGDSITHAAAWTKGWNGVTQDFWKSLQQDYGRTNDTLINLSLSGNTSGEELNNMKYRVDQISQPDIVIISLGLNDIKNGASNGTPGTSWSKFSQNITSIINQIRQINPNCYFLVNNVIPSKYLVGDNINPSVYNSNLQAFCQNLSTSNSVVLANDLNTSYTNLLTNRGYYQTSKNDWFYAQECNHMTVEGSIFMALGWLRGLGFDVNDSRLNYWSYINMTTETNAQKIPVPSFSGNRLSVNMKYVATATDVYDLYLRVQDIVTGQIFDTTTNTTNVSSNNSLLFDIFNAQKDNLLITAVGYSKTSPTKYIFTPQLFDPTTNTTTSTGS